MKHITIILAFLFVTVLSSPSWSEDNSSPDDRPKLRPKGELSLAETVNEALSEEKSSPEELVVITTEAQQNLVLGQMRTVGSSFSRCWNLEAVSKTAKETTVSISLEFSITSKPIEASINLVDYWGGNAADAEIMYKLAKSAILQCGSKGFDLPKEHYSMWQKVEFVFDPSLMN